MHEIRACCWILASGIVIYIISSVLLAKKASFAQKQFEEYEDEAIQHAKEGLSRVFLDFGFVIVGILALVLGADWLVEHGESIALYLGVPEVIISLTLFALGTSLPELATTVVASLKSQGDIITGNAIGSCIFNLLFVMGVTAGIKPLVAVDLSWFDLGVMLGLSVLIVPLMWSRMRLSRREGLILASIATSYSLIVILVQR